MPDPKEGYQLAEISDIREGSFAVVRLVRVRAPLPVPPPLCLPLILFFSPPLFAHGQNKTGQETVFPLDKTFPAHRQNDTSGVHYSDNTSMVYLHPASLLNNLRVRFLKNEIYVRALGRADQAGEGAADWAGDGAADRAGVGN